MGLTDDQKDKKGHMFRISSQHLSNFVLAFLSFSPLLYGKCEYANIRKQSMKAQYRMSKRAGAGTASAESTKRSGYEAHRLTQHRYCSARDASLQNLKAFHNRSCSCSGAAHALHRCEETLSTMFVALIC